VARNSSFRSGLGYLLHFFLYSRLLMKAPQCSQVLLRCMSHVAGGVSTNFDVAPVLKPLTKVINARRPASGTIALPSMPKRSESCLLLVLTIRSLTGGSFGQSKPSLNGMFHVCVYPLFQAKQYHLNLVWWAPTEYAGSTIQLRSYASLPNSTAITCIPPDATICGVFSMNTSFGPNSLVIRSSS